MTKRLGLLGGTFDPVHSGHLIIASYAAEALGLDEVLFIPAQTPPHKPGSPITPIADRVAMVKIAIADDERFSFSNLDLLSDRPSFTSELVERVSRKMPDSELHFIIGADSLRDFPTWNDPQTILKHVHLAVAGRPGIEVTDFMLDSLPMIRRRVQLFESPLIDISSTDIRHRVKSGQRITYLVPREVETHIINKGLYEPH